MSDDTQRALTRLSTVFAQKAQECVHSLFEQHWIPTQHWCTGQRLEGDFDCLVALGSVNDAYQAITLVGLQRSVLPALLGSDDTEPEHVVDVFGELVNTYCGVLADHDALRKTFGVLTQSLPIMFVSGKWILSSIPSIQGTLHNRDEQLFFAYGIQKRQAH